MRQAAPRFLATIALAALLAPTSACDATVDLANAVPRITWVAVEPADADGIARMTLWVSDTEGDAVDVDATVQPGDQDFAVAPGGHGLEGLTTRAALRDPNGQPHLVLWNTSGVTGTVSLHFTADDQRGGEAAPVKTPEFDLGTGLPEPVLVEAAQ